MQQGCGQYVCFKKVLIKSCLVTANTAGDGAGFYDYDATLTMDNSEITSNDAVSNGDGLYVYFGTDIFEGCVFSDNQQPGRRHIQPVLRRHRGRLLLLRAKYNASRGALTYRCAMYKADMSGTCTECSDSISY
jgi:hypothetical protein